MSHDVCSSQEHLVVWHFEVIDGDHDGGLEFLVRRGVRHEDIANVDIVFRRMRRLNPIVFDWRGVNHGGEHERERGESREVPERGEIGDDDDLLVEGEVAVVGEARGDGDEGQAKRQEPREQPGRGRGPRTGEPLGAGKRLSHCLPPSSAQRIT